LDGAVEKGARFGADPDDYDYNTSDGGAEDDGEDDEEYEEEARAIHRLANESRRSSEGATMHAVT
jgi:hypothetical protein